MSRVVAALRSRWAMAAIIAIAMGIALHSVTTGFITDDHVFRALVDSTSERAPASWDLFRFSAGDPVTNALSIRFGHSPWWSAPDFKIHFARPLTSLLFAADVHVFDDNALGYHLHSLIWFAGVLIAAAACLRRMLPRVAATLALAIFAWHAGHSQAFAWPSARHVLVAAVPALFALYARLCGRRWLSLVLLLVALGGSEMGLGIVPFLLAYEVASAYRAGDSSTLRSAIVASWRGTVPIVVVTLAYLVTYHLLGFGVAGGDGYHDPLSDPSGFARVVVPHALSLLGDALLEVPAELTIGEHAAWVAIIGAVSALVVGVIWWRVPSGSRTSTGWLVVAALGATVIATTGIPGGRVMSIAELGFAALLGSMLATPARIGGPVRVVIGLLAVVHLVGAPLRTWRDIDRLDERGASTEAIARDALDLARGRRLIILAASDPYVFLYPRGIANDLEPGALRCWSVLSSARSSHRLERLDDHTIQLTALDAPMLAGFDALFRRRDRPFAVGDSVEQCGGDITIRELRDGLPSAITVRFKRRLDDPELVFASWLDGRLVRVDVRTTTHLPWSPGPARVL